MQSEPLKEKKLLFYQIFRFIIVGGLAFLIDYSTLFLLTDKFKVYYLLSSGISFIVSTVFNYIISMRFVFKSKSNNKFYEVIVFAFLGLIGLFINQWLMSILVETVSLYYMFSKVIATIVVMCWNFITRKLLLEGNMKVGRKIADE